jgi:tetratricopeptide (TPR) repeat protein
MPIKCANGYQPFGSERFSVMNIVTTREEPERMWTPTIIPVAVGERLDSCNKEADEVLLKFAKENYHNYDALPVERVNLLGSVTSAFQNFQWLTVIDYALVLDAFLDTQGYWEEDKRNLELAIKASESLGSGNENKIALLFHDLAVIHLAQGEYERAEGLFTYSLALQRQLGDKLAVSRVLHYLGRIRAKVKDYKLARKFYDQSLSLGQAVNDKRGVSATLHEIGNLYLDKSNFPTAKKYYQRSLALSQELGIVRETATTLHQLGILNHRQGDFDHAQTFFEESLRMRYQVSHLEGIAESLYTLGKLASERGFLERAKQLWEESLSIFEHLGMPEVDTIQTNLSKLIEPQHQNQDE